MKERVREVWRRLRGGELTAARAALSVAVGLAIGVTPLWGLHLWLVLLVCVPLKLDAPVAYLAANISLPFIAPFLSLAEIEIGARVRTGDFLPLTTEAVRAHGVAPFLGEIALGTVIFSPTVAVVGGLVTYLLVRTFKRGAADPLGELFATVAERYAEGSRFTRGYVKSKLAHDPVVRAVAELARAEPLGEVLDVGCGRGQLALVLLLGGGATAVRGFDWDARKVAEARRAAGGDGGPLAATFERADVRQAELAACDTALLIDVIHYFTSDEQDALLARAADAARSRVIVRELDPHRGWRSTVTRIQEAITTTLGFNRGARVLVRPVAAMTAILEKKGYVVCVTPCWEGTPFSNVLLVATRPR